VWKDEVMIDERKARKVFYIYKCVAVRDDNTEITRIIKIPSFFNVEDLAFSLIAMGDAPGIVSSIRLKAGDYENCFDDFDNKIYPYTCSFYELENEDSIEIDIVYEDGLVTKYNCEYIGLDIKDKNITRKTPICVFAQGYSRYGWKTYYSKLDKEKLEFAFGEDKDNCRKKQRYIENEDMHVKWAINDLRQFFTLYQDIYCVSEMFQYR